VGFPVQKVISPFDLVTKTSFVATGHSSCFVVTSRCDETPPRSDVTFFRALLHLLSSPLLLLILYPFFSWRTILGLPTDCSHVSFSTLPGSQLNLTAVCNAECGCLQETYSPVCGSNDVMYYSPCHAGCRKVSENLRNGKKVCPTALCVDKAAAHYLWNVLAGSAKA